VARRAYISRSKCLQRKLDANNVHVGESSDDGSTPSVTPEPRTVAIGNPNSGRTRKSVRNRQISSLPTDAALEGALQTPICASPNAPDLEPEKEEVLQSLSYYALIEVLHQSPPQGSKLNGLTDHVDKLYGPAMHSKLLAALGLARLLKIVAVKNVWVNLHSELHNFQAATGYTGPAGGWQAHKQSLKSQSWKGRYLPVLAPCHQLGVAVQAMKKRGE